MSFNAPQSQFKFGAAAPISGPAVGWGDKWSADANANKEDAFRSATPEDDDDDFGDLVSDILGDTGKKPEKKEPAPRKASTFGKPATAEHQSPFLLLDFRRGHKNFPEGVEIVNQERGEQLLDLEKSAILQKVTKNSRTKDARGDTEIDDPGDLMAMAMRRSRGGGRGAMLPFYNMVWGGADAGAGSDGSDTDNSDDGGDGGQATFATIDDVRRKAPDVAKFKVLSDGSTALLLSPGHRLKIELADLLKDGMKSRDERAASAMLQAAKKKRKEKKKQKNKSQLGTEVVPDTMGDSGMPDTANPRQRNIFSMFAADAFSQEAPDPSSVVEARARHVNEYSVTIDFQIVDKAIPAAGLSVFQTKLCHAIEGAKPGKDGTINVRQTDAECKVTASGGAGVFGSFGNTTAAKIEPQKWTRLVVSVQCNGDGTDNKVKGTMRTFVNGTPCSTISRKEIAKNGRFALDGKDLFLFSSSKPALMGTTVAIRTVRIDSKVCSEEDVKHSKSQDKLISMHTENRQEKLRELRRGLSLARLFPKPPPIWLTPALTGTVGDAFIEGKLDRAGLLPWVFIVLNHAFQRTLLEQSQFLRFFTSSEMAIVSDVAFIFRQSRHVFKQLQKVLSKKSQSQLLTFLRKLRVRLRALEVGESLLLPLLVEGSEMLMIASRSSEAAFRIVVVNTDAEKGLKFHSVNAIEAMPKIKYRVCLVLNDVLAKNALDDVFWMALYNIVVNPSPGDTAKFYTILLPFLTGKPLEESLAEAETASIDGDPHSPRFGDWRSSQRSGTAYVRTVMAAMHYLLRTRGLTSTRSKCLRVALRAQFVAMIQNDLQFIFPDENGERICRLACQQLSYAAVKVSDAASAPHPVPRVSASSDNAGEGRSEAVSPNDPDTWSQQILAAANELVEVVHKSLDACRKEQVSLPPVLELNLDKRTQFVDSLLWETSRNAPNPGQEQSIMRYVPIDFLQLPDRATTRDEASRALWLCDRLATLVDNQPFCVKNNKLHIFAMIEHVFTRVVPLPKPRALDFGRKGADAEVAKFSAQRAKQRERKKGDDDETKKVIDDNGQGQKGAFSKSNGRDIEDEMERFDALLDEHAEEKGNESTYSNGSPVQLDDAAGHKALEDAVTESCVWDQDILFKDQVEIMQTLERIHEHFVAATLSISHCKEVDAVAVTVSGCICAIGDAVMRRRATDHPSEACSHLLGQCRDGRQLGVAGFGLSVSSYATQTATIEMHYPELVVARTAVIDYFTSPQQQQYQKIFTWEDDFRLLPTLATMKYLRNICREVAAPVHNAHQMLLTGDPKVSFLHVNYPELRAFQNIAFFWKFLLNPDITQVTQFTHQTRTWDRMSCQLVWTWKQTEFNVVAFGNVALKCAPPPKLDASGKRLPPPTHRYPSTATPSFYLPDPKVETEDDVIYRPNLPGFQDDDAHPAMLGQRDSELLISYLTVPYLRLPLVVTFFSTDDRVHKLESSKLRNILDSVLFEPGVHLKLWMINVAPVVVPTKHPDLLASPFGLLMNELCQSPVQIMDAVMRLLQGALALDTGTVCDARGTSFNPGVTIILYIIRLASRIDNYLSFLIQHKTNTHSAINEQHVKLRGVDVSATKLDVLVGARLKLRALLFGRFVDLLDSYLAKLEREIAKALESSKQHSSSSASNLFRKSMLACNLHAHKLVLFRNVRNTDELVSDNLETGGATDASSGIDFSRILKNILSSFIYLTTRHNWRNTPLLVPANELYEMLAVQRRRLVTWCNARNQGPLDCVLQASLEISTSAAGSFTHQRADNQNRWSKLAGSRCRGRYAVASTRNQAPSQRSDDEDDMDISPPPLARQSSWEVPVGYVAESTFVGVELDLQIGQMTLRNRHLSSLPQHIQNHPDVRTIFGSCGNLQASRLSNTQHCETHRLVGLKHDIAFWQAGDDNAPPMSDQWERQYDPSELFMSERWIASLFEPVRKSFFNGPQPPAMTFFLPGKATPSHAEVAVLMGEHQVLGGPFKLVYLFRRFKCVHVYECLSHGRQWWWSLHLTTNTKYTLRDMQISTQPRSHGPDPYWWKQGAGTPYPTGVRQCLFNNHLKGSFSSAVIYREATHDQNLSGGREKFIPKRFLYGAIPDCLLQEYLFWQDESMHNWKSSTPLHEQSVFHRRLRGYPINEETTDTMLIVEFGSVGDWPSFLNSGSLDVSSSASDGDRGEFDDVFDQTRRAGVLECTQMPGRSIRVYRFPLTKAKKQFAVHQEVAAQLEGLHLLCDKPRYRQESRQYQAGDTDTDRTESTSGENGADAKFVVGERVLFDFNNRWVSAQVQDVTTVNSEFVYAVMIEANRETRSVKEIELRKSRRKSVTGNSGEGIYHWEGMTDDEDEEWDIDRSKSKSEDKVTKSRLHFGHFEQLPLLFANCGGNAENVEKTLSRFKLFLLSSNKQFENMAALVDAIKAHILADDLESFEDVSTSEVAFDGSREITDSDALIPPSEVEVLLNLLYAPRASSLHSIAATLARIENLSFIAAWTSLDACLRHHHASDISVPFDDSIPFGIAVVKRVELPRLKLVFQPRHGRLYSIDHADLFISNERSELIANLISGIPNALILSDTQDEKQVLVPVTNPVRPPIRGRPFSTRLVMDRTSSDAQAWYNALTQRYYLYPIHLSLSFLMTKGVNSALYLLLLRFLNRNYAAVSSLVDSIATDTKYSAEGLEIFGKLNRTVDDAHPDAHACRLKISLATIDAPMAVEPWNLTVEAAKFINKIAHVSATNQMEHDEEMQLLEDSKVAKSRDDIPAFQEAVHTEYMLTLVFNRLQYLRAIARNGVGEERPRNVTHLEPSQDHNALTIPCRAPPRSRGSPWVYSEDNTVLGVEYDAVLDVKTEDALFHHLFNSKYDAVDCNNAGVDPSAAASHRVVVVYYYVRWTPDHSMVSSRVKELAAQFSMAEFVHVEADAVKWLKHQRNIDSILHFPTFVIYRGGTELRTLSLQLKPSQNVAQFTERVSDSLSTLLQQCLTSQDTAIHVSQLQRTEQVDNGSSASIDTEEIPWIWDEDNRGERISFDNQGFTVKLDLAGDDLRQQQQKFRPHEMERFPSGFGQSSSQCSRCHMQGPSTQTGNERCGSCQLCTMCCQKSPNCGAKSVSNHQQNEKQAAEMRRTIMLLRRRGIDFEAVRGGMCIEPMSGTHRWDMIFKHHPGRNGSGDAVGLCTAEFSAFGPSKAPMLGRDYRFTRSVALYANGRVYFHGNCVAIARSTPSSPSLSNTAEGDVGSVPATGHSNSESSTDSMSPTLCFAQNSVVSVIIDTTSQGGELSFEVNGERVMFSLVGGGQDKQTDVSSFPNLFDRMQTSAVYPVVMTCPIDGFYEELEARKQKFEDDQAKLLGQNIEFCHGDSCSMSHDGNSRCRVCSQTFVSHAGHRCRTIGMPFGSFALSGPNEGSDSSQESNEADLELSSDQLQQLADASGVPMAMIQKHSGADLKKMWDRVQASKEALRVRFPTIHIKLSERAKRNFSTFSGDEPSHISVGTKLRITIPGPGAPDNGVSVAVKRVVEDLPNEGSQGDAPDLLKSSPQLLHFVVEVVSPESSSSNRFAATPKGPNPLQQRQLPAPTSSLQIQQQSPFTANAAAGFSTFSPSPQSGLSVQSRGSAPQPAHHVVGPPLASNGSTVQITVDMSQMRVLEFAQQRDCPFEILENASDSDGKEGTEEAVVWMMKRFGADNVWTKLPDSVNENVEAAYTEFKIQNEKSQTADTDVATCPPGCTKAHIGDGDCLKCGKNWSHHNQHRCQLPGRPNASFPVSAKSTILETHVHVTLDSHTAVGIHFHSKRDEGGNDAITVVQAGTQVPLRRFTVSSTGVQRQIDLLSIKYSPVYHLRARGCLEIIQKVWNGSERMSGATHGLGFLFLYNLLQGSIKARATSAWGSWSSDSPRLALLTSQLLGDRGEKSLCGSIVKLLTRSRSACMRMPRYRDTRKFNRAPVHNGWQDKSEPSCSLGRHMLQVSRLFAKLRRARGVLKYPPKPPFIECPPHPTVCYMPKQLAAPKADVRDSSAESERVDAGTLCSFVQKKNKLSVSDFSRSQRLLHAVSSNAYKRLFQLLQSESRNNLSSGVLQILQSLSTTTSSQLLPKPICEVDTAFSFENKLMGIAQEGQGVDTGASESGLLAIVNFYASWCPGSQALAPALRIFAQKLPTVRFLAVDIDDCDGLAQKYQVKSLPTIVVLRPRVGSNVQGPTVTNVDRPVRVFEGASPRTIVALTSTIVKNSTEAELRILRKSIRTDAFEEESAGQRRDAPTKDELLEKEAEQQEKADDVESQDASAPIMMANLDTTLETMSVSEEQCQLFSTDEAAIKALSKHPFSTHADILSIISHVPYASASGNVLSKLPFDVTAHPDAQSGVAIQMIARLEKDIASVSEQRRHSLLPVVSNLNSQVFDDFFSNSEQRYKTARSQLRRARAQLTKLSRNLHQLKEVDTRIVEATPPLLEAAANSVGRGSSQDLKAKLAFKLRRVSGQEAHIQMNLLYRSLLSSQSSADLQAVNPFLSMELSELLSNMSVACILRASRLGHTNRCIVATATLLEKIDHGLKLGCQQANAAAASLRPNLQQSCAALAALLLTERHYVYDLKQEEGASDANDANKLGYDPRYLIFEFVWNILLRKKQVVIVDEFMTTLAEGRSKVKQMIMGQGKTTVVAPLLALMLADGKSLVLSVVPRALLEMSRTLMRETFANIMAKRIYTLKFDRSSEMRPAVYRSLQNSVQNRGIVVATPTSVKSIMLCFIEALNDLNNLSEPAIRLEHCTKVQEFSKVLGLFRKGVMLLDEVDLILHPLKSELNFPIGAKFDLDGAERGERWSLPIHLIDAIFYAEERKLYVFEASSTALAILTRLKSAIEQGYQQRSLQRLPHIALLDFEFYHTTLKPIFADWAYLWLQKNHLHGVDRNEAVRYIIDGAAARSLANRVVANLIEDVSWLENMRLNCPSAGTAQCYDDEVQFLQKEIQSSEERVELINTIYAAEADFELVLQKQGKEMGDIVRRISKLKTEIDNVESPPDDSMFNQVVVVVSPAFSSASATGPTSKRVSASSSVHTLCTELEAMGYSIRRCDTIKEASARSKELATSGKLRCVIFDMLDYSKSSAKILPTYGGSSQLKPGGYGYGGGLYGGTHKPGNFGFGQSKPTLGNSSFGNSSFGNSSFGNSSFGGSSLLRGAAENQRLNFTALKWCIEGISKPFSSKQVSIDSSRIAIINLQDAASATQRQDCWTLRVKVHDKMSECIRWTDKEGAFADALPVEVTSLSAAELTQKRDQLQQLRLEKQGQMEEQESASSHHKERMLGLFTSLSHCLALEIDRTDQALKKVDAYGESQQPLRIAGDANAQVCAAPHLSVRAAVNGRHHTLDLSNVHSWPTLLETIRSTTKQFVDNQCVLHLNREDESLTPLSPFSLGAGSTTVASWTDYVRAGGGDFSVVQIRHSAELAFAWLSTEEKCSPFDFGASSDYMSAKQSRLRRVLTKHREYLNKLSLAAAVMAKVPVAQKKLLNLSHDWLDTFLPHCLKKVNRVSFGLLSDQECTDATSLDPLLPPSRLKLAVPFVGKDVPSQSSEFAHPDIILGLSIFAYRYQGLRRADFNDLIDLITANFTHEIGPPSDRPSSIMYKQWVLDSGGAIRGMAPSTDSGDGSRSIEVVDESKEVVDLKYLQRSNTEQMQKLFHLWQRHPAVLYHYLKNLIFPKHMRSQHTKISACGQAIGGNILFGRRVGFSGTPSDLLPKELGQCDYEKGDDGKMMSIIMNTTVFDVEKLSNWSIEGILDNVATHEPAFHALIDTGALITGYSNQEVAEQLLQRGLAGFDGVVFLDDEDKKKVLVRATGRIVNQDQCGIPLTKRFAFYDQIHTTGMDIKHRVNARAALTLGKDMVFRDYVQGAYRMRGIGQGQVVTVMVIPEVAELMQRQLVAAKVLRVCDTIADMHVGESLKMIAAWLIINSMQTEQVQWTMLCIQNIANLYRKQAFNTIVKQTIEHFKFDAQRSDPSRAIDEKSEVSTAFVKSSDLTVFDEAIDFSLDQAVPDPVPFLAKLENMIETHKDYLTCSESQSISQAILDEVGRFMMLDGREINLDTEQEREQEQEQQKEVQAKKDQQIEIEKFVDREYSRTKEAPQHWPVSILGDPKATTKAQSHGAHDLHPFYEMSQFKLRHQNSMTFPDYIMASSNYFNRSWNGLRRLKNVVMILEWIPSVMAVEELSLPDADIQKLIGEDVKGGSEDFDIAAQDTMTKALQLLSFEGKKHLTRNDLRNAIEMAVFSKVSESELDALLATFGVNIEDCNEDGMDFSVFEVLLRSGKFLKRQKGRYWVAVSLAEAETLRRLIHVKNACNAPLIRGTDSAIALRYSPATALGGRSQEEERATQAIKNKELDSFCGILFDSSLSWTKQFGHETETKSTCAATDEASYQRAVVHSSFRFFDNDTHFSKPSVHVLIQTLQSTSPFLREKFFKSTLACRRRLALKPTHSAMNQIFQINSGDDALKQRARVSFLSQSFSARALTLYEAFLAIDANNNGYIDPAELFGAMDCFNVPATDAEDLVDFFQICAEDGNNSIDYRCWLDVFDEDPERDDDDVRAQGDDAEADKSPLQSDETEPIVVIPKDAQLLRKIINQRRRDRKRRQREERIRQEAQDVELDEQIYRDELATAAAKSEQGSNPKFIELCTGVDTPSKMLHFHYYGRKLPLRHESVPKSVAATFKDSISFSEEEKLALGPMRSNNGFPTVSCPPRMSVCSKTLKQTICTRMCPKDNTYISQEAERAYLRQQDIIRSTRPTSTYLSCSGGTGFKIELLPEPDPYGFVIMLQVRLPQLPMEGKIASLVSVLPTVQVEKDGAESEPRANLDFFVTTEGRIGVSLASDGASTDASRPSSSPKQPAKSVILSEGSLKSDEWTLVTFTVARCRDNHTQAVVSAQVSSGKDVDEANEIMCPDDHGQLDADDVRKGSSARCDRCGNVHVDGEPHVLSGRTCNTCGYWVCGVCCASLLPSPTLAAAKGAFETIRVPYSYPSSLNILHAGKQSEARGGDVAQIGFIACGSDIDKTVNDDVVEQFFAGLIDPVRLKQVVDKVEGTYKETKNALATLKHVGGARFSLHTYPRASASFNTSRGVYSTSSDTFERKKIAVSDYLAQVEDSDEDEDNSSSTLGTHMAKQSSGMAFSSAPRSGFGFGSSSFSSSQNSSGYGSFGGASQPSAYGGFGSKTSAFPSTSSGYGGIPVPKPASSFSFGSSQSSGFSGGFGKSNGFSGSRGFQQKPSGFSFGSKPSGFSSQPGGFGGKPSGFGGKPSGFGSKPSGFGSKPSGFGSKPSGFGSKSSGFGNNSGFGSTSSGFGSLQASQGSSAGFGRPGAFGASSGFGKQSSKFSFGATSQSSAASSSEDGANVETTNGNSGGKQDSPSLVGNPGNGPKIGRFTKYLLRFRPTLLRPSALRDEFVLEDVLDSEGTVTIHPNRSMSLKLVGVALKPYTLIVPRRVRWYEGLHMLKCLAKLLDFVERPAERDALVRLATKPKILDYIIDKISSEFHPFLRKPISVMVDMLQFCGHITIVEDSETPVVVGQQVDGKWPADELQSFSASLRKQLVALHDFDVSLWKSCAALRRPASECSPEEAAKASAQLQEVLNIMSIPSPTHGKEWSQDQLRELLRSPRGRLAQIVGLPLALVSTQPGIDISILASVLHHVQREETK